MSKWHRKEDKQRQLTWLKETANLRTKQETLLWKILPVSIATREMITPRQKSTAWKQVSLSLVKDSLTVLNNKRLMESEMFYPLTFQLPKHEQLQQASMKTLMVFSSSCLLSITYFHMSNWNVYCELLCESLQTNVKEDIVELWICFVHFMSYSL
jgi:hypothetical protein